MTTAATLERRQHARSPFPERVGIQLLEPSASIAPDGINLSEGGLCLRLERALEVRSFVRLQLSPEAQHPRRTHSIQCEGRVAWVTQRLDLRTAPPFLFDTGIEFVDPPVWVRRWLIRSTHSGRSRPAPRQGKALAPWEAAGRRFLAYLEHDARRPSRWHLVVTAEGVPCFSGRYASARAAESAWARFKRGQAKRRVVG
ncbi:MAG: PilZ domain-containing protein [Candidatus Omnitrophica bacterium]|nr:PilZ domain-containing protein [Candidatus Omnitrophota bacterium]